MEEFISAIDIGTTKVCALLAGVTHDSLGNLALRVLGEGTSVSQGIRRGVVVNVSEAVASGLRGIGAGAGPVNVFGHN